MLMRGVLPLLLCLPLVAAAATRCYNETVFPAAVALEAETSGAIRVTLGEYFALPDGRLPVLRYSPDGGWQRLPEAACTGRNCFPSSSPACRTLLSSLPGDALSGFEPGRISACIEYGDHIYFGLHAYRGEGIVERGGLGRYERASGKVEMRVLAELADFAVSRLLHDGTSLWIATEREYECDGHMAGRPLFLYRWEQDEVEPVPEPGCGFIVYDLMQAGSDIWLATDLGVSRLWQDAFQDYRGRPHFLPRTTHFVSRRGTDLLPQQVKCDALYDELLPTVSEATGGADGDSPFGAFFSNLASHRPAYLEGAYLKHHRRRPADAWWAALQEGGREQAAQMLARGVSPHWHGTGDRSVVTRALEEEAFGILEFLLASGVDLDASGGESAVDFAVRRQRQRLLHWLLEQGVRPGREALPLVIERRDEGAVRLLLDVGASPDVAAWEPPLLTAVRFDAIAIARMLIAAGAKTHIEGLDVWRQPLVVAVQRKNMGLVEVLARRPAAAESVQWLLQNGHTELAARLTPSGSLGAEGAGVLTGAIRKGDAARVQALLQQGAAEGREQQRESLLFTLSRRHEALLALLLAHGYAAALEAGDMPQMIVPALRHGDMGLVRRAVDAGARLTREPLAWERLRDAAATGDADTTALLLRAGVSPWEGERSSPAPAVSVRPECSGTARHSPACTRRTTLLHLAAAAGAAEVTDMLLAAGVDSALRDTFGATALMLAAAAPDTAVLRRLVALPEPLSADTDDLGNTPLHYAAWGGVLDNVRVLLMAAPAALEARNHMAATPLLVAAEAGHAAVVRWLLEQGADHSAAMNPARRVRYAVQAEDLVLPRPGLQLEEAPPMRIQAGGVIVGTQMADFGHVGGAVQSVTALQIARQRGHRAVAAVLEAAGAIR